MSEPQRHPRRRPLRNAILPPLSTVLNDVELPQRRSIGPEVRSLRKGATFHAPSSTPSDNDGHPTLNVPTLPRRSPTCPQTLEEVIAASQNRMSGLLGSVERTLSGLGKDSTASSLLDNDLPVPRGVLDANILHTDPMDIDQDPRKQKTRANRHIAVSDSGVGTSIGGSQYGEAKGTSHRPFFLEKARNNSRAANTEWYLDIEEKPVKSTLTKAQGISKTAITRSICPDNLGASQPSLSSRGTKQIDRYIITPILRENKLKPFHPLARGVPERISKNDITCLRDLEKTLLYLAPHYATSQKSYISFCEFTIQCLHTTVNHLNDRDQRLPADRPYTNGYFLDLVEQIRQYAAMVNVSRARRASGRDKSSKQADYSSDEELVLKGGLGQTGQPAELVRQKKGKVISLRTGEAYKESKPVIPTLKRALSNETCDDSVVRSMARRKKNEPPMNINKKCPHCDKVFRRPCDFTKHEKTHIRPWKCSHRDCKYFERGWPTEKERDRHVNDKHSASPPLYKCTYYPCTYSSKRESNCKQHMEKTHNYIYVRTKNNARNGGRKSAQASPKTPNIGTPMTGEMSAFTPNSAATPSPYTSPYQQQFNNVPNEPAVYGGNVQMTNNNAFAQDFELYNDTVEPAFDAFAAYKPTDFSTFHATLQATDRNQYVPASDMAVPPVSPSHSSDVSGDLAQVPDYSRPNNGTLDTSSPVNSNLLNPNAMVNGSSHLDVNFEWDAVDTDYSAVDFQLMGSSVNSSAAQSPRSPYQASSTCATSPDLDHPNTNLSPGGQGNAMLYSPSLQSLDEGFFEPYHEAEKPMNDFSFLDQAMDNTLQEQHTNSIMGAPMEDLGLGNSNPMFPALMDQFQDTTWPELPSVGPMEAAMDIDDFLKSDQI